MSRCIRGPLPSTEEMLKPQIPDALELLQQRQNKQKDVHDRKARDLKPLAEGDKVFVRTDNEPQWTEGNAIAETAQPRSYLVNTGSNQLRRNRVHLKSAPNKGLEVEHDTTHSEVTIAPRAEIHSEVPASPLPVTPTPTPQRSARQNCGALSRRFDNFAMI